MTRHRLRESVQHTAGAGCAWWESYAWRDPFPQLPVGFLVRHSPLNRACVRGYFHGVALERRARLLHTPAAAHSRLGAVAEAGRAGKYSFEVGHGCYAPRGQVLAERAAVYKHRAHACDTSHIPRLHRTVECLCTAKHPPHVDDGRRVPVVQRLVEMKRLRKHAPHAGDQRHVPATHTPVEIGGIVEHRLHRDRTRCVPLRKVGVEQPTSVREQVGKICALRHVPGREWSVLQGRVFAVHPPRCYGRADSGIRQRSWRRSGGSDARTHEQHPQPGGGHVVRRSPTCSDWIVYTYTVRNYSSETENPTTFLVLGSTCVHVPLDDCSKTTGTNTAQQSCVCTDQKSVLAVKSIKRFCIPLKKSNFPHGKINATAGHAFRPYGHAFTLSPLAWERKNRSLSTPRARFLLARRGFSTK